VASIIWKTAHKFSAEHDEEHKVFSSKIYKVGQFKVLRCVFSFFTERVIVTVLNPPSAPFLLSYKCFGFFWFEQTDMLTDGP